MNIMRYNDQPKSPGLVAAKAPVPQPGSGEVLIKVHAAGVTPTELSWYPTTHNKDGTARRGAVPGHEFSGVIETVGPKVEEFIAGQAVFGMNDWFAEGATAEYCVARPGGLALKPAKVKHAEAAAVPIGALTAWQGLKERAGLMAGERVLIHGGAGAVGVYAIQLAWRMGAHVVTTASRRHEEFLHELGAERVIDYRHGKFDDEAVDVVFDGVGGATLQQSWAVLKPGGRVVTIAAGSEGSRDARTRAAFFIVEPNGAQLTEIAGMLEKKELQVVVDTCLPLADAPAAYAGLGRREIRRGKVVISLIE